jgi:hypothetical protein
MQSLVLQDASDTEGYSSHVYTSESDYSTTPVKRAPVVAGNDTDVNTKLITPTVAGSRMRDICSPTWHISDGPLKTRSRFGMVKMTYGATGATFNVQSSKTNKAQMALDPQTYTFLLVPTPAQCRCTRVCTQPSLKVCDVLRLRRPLWERDETMVVQVARLLRADNIDLLNARGTIPPQTPMAYKIDGRLVCCAFWCTVMGTSDHTIRKSRVMARTGSFITGHAGTTMSKLHLGDVTTGVEASDALKCHAYWHQYFDVMCQKPNDKFRLFPTAESFKSLYDTNFKPYVKRMGWVKIPSDKVFIRVATTHDDFDDVKRKRNHTHCRCDECTNCKEIIARGFRNGEDLEIHRRRWASHQKAVKDWRYCENYWTQLSCSSPHEVTTSYETRLSLTT